MKLNHEYHSTISNVTCHFSKFWKHRYTIVGCDPWWNWSLLQFQKVSLNSVKTFLQSFLYGDNILPMVQITNNMPSKCKCIFLNRMNSAMTIHTWFESVRSHLFWKLFCDLWTQIQIFQSVNQSWWNIICFIHI
jgi:hypothetical protein